MDRPEHSGMPEEDHVEDHYDIETRRIHGIVYGDNGRGLQQDPSVLGRDRRGRRYGTWVPEYDSKYLAMYPDIPYIPRRTFGLPQNHIPAPRYTLDGRSPFATPEQYSSSPYSRSSAPYTPSGPYPGAPSQPFVSPYAPQLPADISSSPGLPYSDDQHAYNRSWLGAEAFNSPPASSSLWDQTSPTPGSSANQHGRQCLSYGFHRRGGNHLIRDRRGHGSVSTNTGSHSENNRVSKPRKKELNSILNAGFYGGRNNNTRLREDPQLQHAIEASLRNTLSGNEPQANQQGDQQRSIDNVFQDDGANLAPSSLEYENPKIHTPSNGVPKELTQGFEPPHNLGLNGNQSWPHNHVSKGESEDDGPGAAVPDQWGSVPEEPLPHGWEMYHDDTGEVYFHNRTTGTSTWDDPRLIPLSDEVSTADNANLIVDAAETARLRGLRNRYAAFLAGEHVEKGAEIPKKDKGTWAVDPVTRGKIRFLDDGTLEWHNGKTKQWHPAVMHGAIREELIERAQQAYPEARYLFPDPPGCGPNDVTSIHPDSLTWGPDRVHLPPIIWQWDETAPGAAPRQHPAVPNPMMFDDMVVLDRWFNPIRDWPIPATLSSNTQTFKFEAWRRHFDGLAQRELSARMPDHIFKGNMLDGEQKKLRRLNSLINMPSERFRLQKGCASWTRRSDTDELKARLLEFYDNYNYDPIENNSTWGFGRDLVPWEQDWLGLNNRGTHTERGNGRALDDETRDKRNSKKTKETKAKAAAAWPHLRSAGKRYHVDDTDHEQTETSPDKRVRLNNQPGLQQSFSTNTLAGPSGPRRLNSYHNHAWNQLHRDLNPHDTRHQPHGRIYQSGRSGSPWQPTEHGELYDPQNLVQSPPLRPEWQPEERRGTAPRTVGVHPQIEKISTPEADSSFGDDSEDGVARETGPNDIDGEDENNGADEQPEDIVKTRNAAAGLMPDPTAQEPFHSPSDEHSSLTLHQTAQQEGLGPLMDYLGYENSNGAGTDQNFRDGPQEATSQSPVIQHRFRSRHPEMADELHKHRKRTRDALGEQEGYLGNEGDAGEHERKRRRASQNTEQSVRHLSSRPAYPGRRQAIRTAQEDQYQQRFGEALAQRVADVVANARFHGIAYTEVAPRSEADLANVERALQPTLNAYYAYIQQAAPATDRFQSYASRWRAIRHEFEQQWTATSQAQIPYLIELPALQPGMTEWQHDLEVLYKEPCHRDPPLKDEYEEEL